MGNEQKLKKVRYMVNDNIITEEMYKKVRGIIRGELAHFTCYDCKRHDAEHYPCDCGMMYNEMQFKPRNEYVDKIAKKICTRIGELIEEKNKIRSDER